MSLVDIIEVNKAKIGLFLLNSPAMEEENSQEILLNSLQNSGVPIPPGISAIQQLTPPTLYYICSKSICLIEKNSSFPTSLPEDSMADCFRICSDLASAFQRLGFIGDISFHKFLYPSEEDLHKLVRFLVSRLAESSEAQKASDEDNITVEVVPEVEELRLQRQAVESVNFSSGDALARQLNESDSNLSNLDCTDNGVQKSRARIEGSAKADTVSEGIVQDSVGELESAKRSFSENEGPVDRRVNEYVHKHDRKLFSLQDNSSELPEVTTEACELQCLEDEYNLLKEAVAIVFDDKHRIDFNIHELTNLVEGKRKTLVKQETHWNFLKVPLEEKKRSLEEACWTRKPDAHEKLQKKKAIEHETESVLSEIKRREEELSALSAELANQKKVASRQSFVHRIKEITKNSRKQDIDIERILKDTRELQLESNSIQERLNRTFAVVNETVFREARKDPVGREAYKILTKIHETFEQTSEKILATDRIRREVGEYEAKLANMASQSLNIDKLQVDIEAIRKENDILEQNLGTQMNM